MSGNYGRKSTPCKVFCQGLPSFKNICTFKVEIKHNLNIKPLIKSSYAKPCEATVEQMVYDSSPNTTNGPQNATFARTSAIFGNLIEKLKITVKQLT